MLFILHQDNVLWGGVFPYGQFYPACLGFSKLRETNLASTTSNFPTEKYTCVVLVRKALLNIPLISGNEVSNCFYRRVVLCTIGVSSISSLIYFQHKNVLQKAKLQYRLSSPAHAIKNLELNLLHNDATFPN